MPAQLALLLGELVEQVKADPSLATEDLHKSEGITGNAIKLSVNCWGVKRCLEARQPTAVNPILKREGAITSLWYITENAENWLLATDS